GDELRREADAGSVRGIADYRAPEQAVNSQEADVRADVYSLGATFYFLLVGKSPFQEGTVAQKLIWHQVRQPPPIPKLRPEVPEALVAVIEKMMAKDPAQRYQTPAEVAAALAPFTQAPVGPPPEEEMPKLSPAVQGGPESSPRSPLPTARVTPSGERPGSSQTVRRPPSSQGRGDTPANGPR